jgi:hypothetical protein
LRSARAVRVEPELPVLPVIEEPVPEEVPDDIVEPLEEVPEDAVEPVLEPVEPVMGAADEVLPVAAPPPGVPVAPIGVPCVLRWPAPVAALEDAAGGVPWAKAKEAASTAVAAIRVLDVADISGSPVCFVDRRVASHARLKIAG